MGEAERERERERERKRKKEKERERERDHTTLTLYFVSFLSFQSLVRNRSGSLSWSTRKERRS